MLTNGAGLDDLRQRIEAAAGKGALVMDDTIAAKPLVSLSSSIGVALHEKTHRDAVQTMRDQALDSAPNGDVRRALREAFKRIDGE